MKRLLHHLTGEEFDGNYPAYYEILRAARGSAKKARQAEEARQPAARARNKSKNNSVESVPSSGNSSDVDDAVEEPGNEPGKNNAESIASGEDKNVPKELSYLAVSNQDMDLRHLEMKIEILDDVIKAWEYAEFNRIIDESKKPEEKKTLQKDKIRRMKEYIGRRSKCLIVPLVLIGEPFVSSGFHCEKGIRSELETDSFKAYNPKEHSYDVRILELKSNILDRSKAKYQLCLRAAFFDYIMSEHKFEEYKVGNEDPKKGERKEMSAEKGVGKIIAMPEKSGVDEAGNEDPKKEESKEMSAEKGVGKIIAMPEKTGVDVRLIFGAHDDTGGKIQGDAMNIIDFISFKNQTKNFKFNYFQNVYYHEVLTQ